MIFFFDRNFGSKDRERLEDFQIEAEDFEVAIKAIQSSQPQAKVERLGLNLFLSWDANGKEYFDHYHFSRRTQALDTSGAVVNLKESGDESPQTTEDNNEQSDGHEAS